MVDEMTLLDYDQFSYAYEGSTDRNTTSGCASSINGMAVHAPSARDGEYLAEAAETTLEIQEELAPLVTPLEASNLNASLDLAYINLMKNRLDQCEYDQCEHDQCEYDQCEYSYARVVAGCKKLYGVSFLFTLQAICALAVLRDERKGYYEAESICRQTIEGFEELGAAEDRLEYQHHLDVLLHRTDCAKESEVLICSTPNESNKLSLKHQERGAIRSLLELYLELNRLGNPKSLRSRMKTMFEVLNKSLEIDSDHLPELLPAVFPLANARSMLGEFVLAHSVFSSVLPKLELLNNEKHGMQKIHEYQVFGVYNRGQDVELDAAKYLLLTLEGLVKLGRKDDAVTSLVKNILIEVLLAEFDEFCIGGGIDSGDILEFIEKRLGNILLEENGQSESSMGSENSDDEEDYTMRDVTSCKYGITYSVSSITGISDSIFMVP